MEDKLGSVYEIMGKKQRSIISNNLSFMSRQVKKETDILCSELLEKSTLMMASQSIDDFCQIYDLTDKLIKIQKKFTRQHLKRDEKLEEFVNWLKSNGAIFGNVLLHKFSDNNYGILVSTDIKEHDIVLQIPHKLLMSQSTAQNSLLGKLLQNDKIVSCLPNVFVALHMLCEYFSELSFWRPYLDMLPESYNTILYYNLNEIKMLKGTSALNEAINQYKSIARQYAYFYKLFQNNPDFSKLPIKNFCFEDYRWAVSTVQTRQNCIRLDNESQLECCLIPLFDMCNHAYGNISTGFNKEKNIAECFAMKEYNAGDEFKIYYGDRSNSEFLIHNGFIPDTNPSNKLLIKLGVSKNDSLYSMKAEILARIPINTNKPFYVKDGPGCPLYPDVIAFLRVFHMNLEQLKMYLMCETASELRNQLLIVEQIVDLKNEIKVWQFLEVRCKLLLNAHPQLEDMDQPETEIKCMINELIKSEKIILCNAIEYCVTHLKELTFNRDEY